MARKYHKGPFTPKNKQKYIGNGTPIFRSNWELVFMNFCDMNEHVLSWASEPLRIPYRNPFTNKMTTYVPDFLISYRHKDGTVKTELIEIKPKKQCVIEGKMSTQNRAIVTINHAKWEEARKFCKQQHIEFRIVTEDDIFHMGGKRK
jgi:TnsA endonuclease N terminal